MTEFRSVNVPTDNGEVVTLKVPVGPMPSAAQAKVLREAFWRVAQDADWKGRIDKVLDVRPDEIPLVLNAIEFMTATAGTATVTMRPVEDEKFDGLVRVHFTALGYRAGPAGP